MSNHLFLYKIPLNLITICARIRYRLARTTTIITKLSIVFVNYHHTGLRGANDSTYVRSMLNHSLTGNAALNRLAKPTHAAYDQHVYVLHINIIPCANMRAARG